jgi:hypothetical protein
MLAIYPRSVLGGSVVCVSLMTTYSLSLRRAGRPAVIINESPVSVQAMANAQGISEGELWEQILSGTIVAPEPVHEDDSVVYEPIEYEKSNPVSCSNF